MAKRRILIVDDEPSFTRLLKLNLEQTGAYEVRAVHQGQRGLEAALEFKPDLILLDVIMHDMDGGEVAAQLKADPRVNKTPIVFLTAVVSPHETGERSEMIGGYPFLAKPIHTDQLLACIARSMKA